MTFAEGDLVAVVACFLASIIGAEILRRIALRRSLLDRPNERSLHTTPTPRLGGIAIVAGVCAATAVRWFESNAEDHILVVVCAVVAALGFRDDIRPLSAAIRLTMQIAAAAFFLHFVGVPPLLVARGTALALPSAVTAIVLVVWIVGVLNIFNFMDGMDGLAGWQTVGACVAFACLLGASAATASRMCILLASAALGFLTQNMPPARIFMGDGGSTFIGMVFATLAVVGLHHGVPITELALGLAPFLLDGAFTIVRRASRKEPVWKAHRTHLYQRAVETGLGHRDVLLVYIVWIAVSCAAAVVAASSTFAVVSSWAVVVAGLLLVRRWVLRRESERAHLPQP